MKERKSTNKIQENNQEIDWNDDIGQMLLWSMKDSYKEYDKELEEKPETRDLKPSEDLFGHIIDELKEQGEWDKKPELDAPDIYHMLSKEDREALALGRKIKKINRRTTFMKRAAIAACVLICLFGASMTNEANRKYVVALWNEIVGESQLRIKINVQDDENGEVGQVSEDEAMEAIRENLGIQTIEMLYKPKGMEFSSYRIGKEDKNAIFFYDYRDSLFTVTMQSKDSKSKYTQEFDGVVVNEISSRVTNEKVKIWKITNTEDYYAACLDGIEDSYIIQGYIKEEEFIKIIEGINFSL